MKKFFVFVTVFVLAAMMLVGCGSQTAQDESDLPEATTLSSETEPTTTKDDDAAEPEKEEAYNLPKIPSEYDIVNVYRKEVKERLNDVENEKKFLSDEEIRVLEENGYDVFNSGTLVLKYSAIYGELEEFVYPVIFKGTNGIEMLYTSANGYLYSDAIVGKTTSGFSSNYYSEVHCHDTEEEPVIHVEETFAISYVEKTGKVKVWQFDEVVREYTLPENSVYAGKSFWEGYIFRSGTDVYSLIELGCYNSSVYCLEVIAHNVEKVISADFMMGSDDWSQPLFLMTDGTVKGYCSWYGGNDKPVDDESHLKELTNEGGYRK